MKQLLSIKKKDDVDDNDDNGGRNEEQNYALQYNHDDIDNLTRRRRQQPPPKSSNAFSSFILSQPSSSTSPTKNYLKSKNKISDKQKRRIGIKIKDTMFPRNNPHSRHSASENRKRNVLFASTTIILLWMAYQTWYVFTKTSWKRWKMMAKQQRQQRDQKTTTKDLTHLQKILPRQREDNNDIPIEYYNYIYNTSSMPPQHIVDQYDWSSFSHKEKEETNISFLSYASPDITNHGCDVTIVLMDPNIPLRKIGHKVWFMLESVAEYVEYMEQEEGDDEGLGNRKRKNRECMLIQTASCKVIDQQTTHDTYQADVQTIGNILYDRSLPLFQRMIERGQVRIAILNHTKYDFKSCSNFFNPSSALMNLNYWKDEFIDNIDSDLILSVQDDCVFCRTLDPSRWKDIAYVGSPWSYANGFWHYVWHMWNPKRIFKLFHIFLMCDKMEEWWNDWVLVENRSDSTKEHLRVGENKRMGKNHLGIADTKQTDSLTEKGLSRSFPPVCNVDGYGAVGNGGLTIRSREWLIKAIEVCPHIKWSGIDTTTNSNTPVLCRATKNDINEDAYFATVLNGISAPMPKAYDAAIFSVEMMWPEEVASIYGPWEEEERMDHIRQRWTLKDQLSFKHGVGGTFKFDGLDYTVPIGMHKPWWYQPTEMLQSKKIVEECKFLKYMFQPEESRWAQIGSGPVASWWQLKRYFRLLPFVS